MKKIFVAIFVIFSFATYADTTLTSKNYVDSQVATKQDIIPAKNTNTVLTHSGELGNIGEKKIYNSTGAYAGHSTELVTAGVADSAIQNAIDTEFVCVEWHENEAHTDENCLGWQIRNVFHKSKNLFDINIITTSAYTGSGRIVNNGNDTLSVTDTLGNAAISSRKALSELAPSLTVGNTYTLSFETTGCVQYIYLGAPALIIWIKGTSKTITQDMLDARVYFYACHNGQTPSTATISDIQIEEGTTATAYQPYGNTYIPQQ